MGKKVKGKTMSLSEFAGDAATADPMALPTAPREDRWAPSAAPREDAGEGGDWWRSCLHPRGARRTGRGAATLP